MAHRFAYTPSGITFTSSLGDIKIFVDGTFVDVRLTASTGETLLSERYYAYGDYVTLYDIGSLAENYLRSAVGEPYATFTLALLNASGETDASARLQLLYCDRLNVCTDIDVFLRENFLTTLAYRRFAPDDMLILNFVGNAGDGTGYKVLYQWRRKGEREIHTGSYFYLGNRLAETGVVQLNIEFSHIVQHCCNTNNLTKYDCEIVTFTIQVGQRSVTCFVDYSLTRLNNFYFYNCFNALEQAAFPMTTKAKTEVQHSSAVVNNVSQFYNQRTNKTYEVESGALTSDEAEWIDQLLSSFDISRLVANDCDEESPLLMQRVLITDCTCELSDGDEKPPVVKFTWRYADNRPLVRLTASPGIFTQPYNPNFS